MSDFDINMHNLLVDDILRMAKHSGVYRSEIFEAHSYYTQKEISEAIKVAKKKGLYSIADMKDEYLGTYYQYDGKLE